MVRILVALFVLSLFSCSGPKEEESEIIDVRNKDSLNLIPKPAEISTFYNTFKLDKNTGIRTYHELDNEYNYLKNLINSASSFELKEDTEHAVSNITLSLDSSMLINNDELYRLVVLEDEIWISGSTPEGVMRAIQTLRQLFVPAFHSGEKRDSWYLPCVEIKDFPKFDHRGLLLDVCRHFFTKEDVMTNIDLLAYYKMNTLHFHLTEDQGWRIESDKYPLLNTISSQRTELDGTIYGGLYSKEDLKEIVAYASERHITVIPEIELPGHSQAALAAYPHLSCNGGPIEVANDWGVFKEIYCAGNDSTFIFLEDILTEVMEIFPSEYIHIGGDEAPKTRWESCPKCQKRMKDNGLKDEKELQSYFIKRIEDFLSKHDRKLIGWDEILEGGLSETATVQSWRGIEGGIEAASTKHNVIMSPTSHCYLDYGLDAIDLEKIYSFNPIPESLETKYHQYIIGGECNMWTEHVPDRMTLDNRILPRMLAFSEVMWSKDEDRLFEEFFERLQSHYSALDAMGFQYGPEMIPLEIKHIQGDGSVCLNIEHFNEVFTSKYRVLMEGSDTNWVDFNEHDICLESSCTIEFQAFKKGKPYGDPISSSYSIHKGLNSKVDYSEEWNEWYKAGGYYALNDGKLGSLNFRDGNWQGFWGNDLSIEMDFGGDIEVQSINANFYQYSNAWIMAPKSLSVTLYDDMYSEIRTYTVNCPKIEIDNQKHIIPFQIDLQPTTGVSHIKVNAKNYGVMPGNHDAAGEPAWIFVDEIIVN